MYIRIHDQSVVETKQRKETKCTPEDSSLFLEKKKGCFRRDSNLHTMQMLYQLSHYLLTTTYQLK